MNKKQLVTVWVGVALMIGFAYWRLCAIGWWFWAMDLEDMDLKELLRLILLHGDLPLIVAALAVGLTCTFADKKPKGEQKQ